MMNEKGFGSFEVLTILVVIICIVAFLLYQVLGNTASQKFKTMIENANSFGRTIVNNPNSFSSQNTIYLDEAINDGSIKSIKSPFGGICDGAETKYYRDENGVSKVNLRCGDYLIDNLKIGDTSPSIYKISKWSTKKPSGKDVEEKVLYNCLSNGSELYNNYMEDLYLVYMIRRDYGVDVYSLDDISECQVVSKTFYRTKEVAE